MVRLMWWVSEDWVDPTLVAFLRDHSDLETRIFNFGTREHGH